MKIKIITIHAMHNPGSVLQAYALQQYLSITHEVKIIDYRPEYFYSEGVKWKLILKKLLYGKIYHSRAQKFDTFIGQNLELTERYNNYQELQEGKIEADVFVTGSDQLWNTDFPCGKDPAFYLKFVQGGKKISYSTSVGKTILDVMNRAKLLEELPAFESLAVREKSNAEELSKALGRKVYWVCDPVFLLPLKEYLKFIDKKPLIASPYIVVYLSKENEILDNLIEVYKEKGYYVVLAGGFTRRCKCDFHIKDLGPIEFLNLIYYAECIVSGSFHATAFCHIFHKNFVSIVPTSNGERISCLLELSGLQERELKKEEEISHLLAPIDWSVVDEKIMPFVEASKEYISKALEENLAWMEKLKSDK